MQRGCLSIVFNESKLCACNYTLCISNSPQQYGVRNTSMNGSVHLCTLIHASKGVCVCVCVCMQDDGCVCGDQDCEHVCVCGSVRRKACVCDMNVFVYFLAVVLGWGGGLC